MSEVKLRGKTGHSSIDTSCISCPSDREIFNSILFLQTMLAYIFTLILVSEAYQSNNCSTGSFTTHDGKCMFKCEEPNLYYIPTSALSFNFIAYNCGQVQDATQIGLCSTLNDLSWPTTSCHCPSCKCKTPGQQIIAPYENLFSRECWNCTCTIGDSFTSSTPPTYKCDRLSSVWPYNWDDFVCQNPPIVCIDSISGESHATASSWYSGSCDTFCYCNSSGQAICEEGFDAIISSTYQPLVDAFHHECAEYLTDCTSDASRMIASDDIDYCDCPRCDCGKHSVGDSWFTEYQTPININSMPQTFTTCTKCSCFDSTIPKAECETCDDEYSGYDISWRYPISSNATCPPSKHISCHQAKYYDPSEPRAHLKVPEPLNSVAYHTNAPEAWCAWQVATWPDTVYYEKPTSTWGSANVIDPYFCGIYGVNEECSYSEWNADYINCNGVRVRDWGKQYNYCCNTDDCNFKDIDISKCPENKRWSASMQSMSRCEEIWCVPLGGEPITCSVFEDRYEKWEHCVCSSYKMIYEDANDEWRTYITQQMNVNFEVLGFYEDASKLGCTINFECDFRHNSRSFSV
eukprot:956205_1